MKEKQIYSVGIDITIACFTKHGELFSFKLHYSRLTKYNIHWYTLLHYTHLHKTVNNLKIIHTVNPLKCTG